MGRTWLVALAVVAGLAWSPPASIASPDALPIPIVAAVTPAPASADSVSPPGGFVNLVRICPPSGCDDPSRPICAGDSIQVLLDGAFPNGCYTLTGVDLFIPPWVRASDARMIVPWVRLLYDDHTCEGGCPAVAPTFQARVVVPPLPPGTYGLTVMQQPAGCDTIPLLLDPVAFTVRDSCDTLPPPPNHLPYVDQVTFCRTEGPGACEPICPTDSVVMKIAGTFPSDCYGVRRIELLPSIAAVYPPMPTVRVVVDNGCCYGRPCIQQPNPWTAAIKLPQLPPGNHPVILQMAEVCCTDSVPPIPLPAAEYRVAVSGACPPLPFLHSVLFCGNTEPDSGGVIPCEPLCAGDSISVILSGIFPSECYELRRVEVVPPPPSFREAAPSLLVVVDNHCCQDRICLPDPRSWYQMVKLPPMSAGPYDLTVRVAELCCSDWVPPGSQWPEAHFPFAVDTCDVPPPVACLVGGWLHPNGPGNCDAFLANGSSTVSFTVHSTMALAGLEGTFRLGYMSVTPALGPAPPPPVITSIVPIGVASDMHLRWTAIEGGARFVLFADDGAPIPPSTPFTGDPVPVLAVTVAMPDGVAPLGDIAVQAVDVLGADAAGDGVPGCRVPYSMRYATYPARICTSASCDFNRDGLANIRDLVMMVRCLHSANCPNSQRFDCDEDGGFDLDDVLCCAWTMLRPPCPSCPPDTTAPRKENGVRLVLDGLESAAGQVRAGLRIDGADRVGGVRLEFRFPSDRYEFLGLEGVGNDWLALTDVDGDAIVVGLVRLGEIDGALAAQSVTCSGTLKLRLKPGMSPGGELTAAGAEFSGTDGVRLEVAPGNGTLSLGGGAEFALSDNRPDPFSGATRFTLTLPQAADVDLGVFDVGGRRVATLHRGRLTAGVSEFVWNGASDRGGRVASGVYFYLATVGGRTLSKKMVVLND